MEAHRLGCRTSGRLTLAYTVCTENSINTGKSCAANNYSLSLITIIEEETLFDERRIKHHERNLNYFLGNAQVTRRQ